MLQKVVAKSELQANAREIRLLIQAILHRSAAVEARLLVTRDHLEVLVQIPVENERGRRRLLRRCPCAGFARTSLAPPAKASGSIES